MSKRLTLSLSEEEYAQVMRLREALNPGASIAGFAADALMANVEAELHGMECQCHEMAQALYNWRPQGRPN